MFLIKITGSTIESRKVLLALLIINLWFASSYAFKCYVCDSKNDVECTEDLPADSKLVPQDCSKINDAKYCIKTTNIFAGEFGTKRFCSSNDYGSYCKYVRQPAGDREYRSCVYTCDTPNCNKSSQLIHIDHTLPWVLATLVVSLLRQMLNARQTTTGQ